MATGFTYISGLGALALFVVAHGLEAALSVFWRFVFDAFPGPLCMSRSVGRGVSVSDPLVLGCVTGGAIQATSASPGLFGVATRTYRLLRPVVTATQVFKVGYWLKVARVATGWIAAQVVKHKVVRHRAVELFVGQAMRKGCSVVAPLEAAISQFRFVGCPRPASIRASRGIHLGPEALFYGSDVSDQLSSIWRVVAIDPLPVKSTEVVLGNQAEAFFDGAHSVVIHGSSIPQGAY